MSCFLKCQNIITSFSAEMTVCRKIVEKRLPYEIKSIQLCFVVTFIPEICSYFDYFNADIRPHLHSYSASV